MYLTIVCVYIYEKKKLKKRLRLHNYNIVGYKWRRKKKVHPRYNIKFKLLYMFKIVTYFSLSKYKYNTYFI